MDLFIPQVTDERLHPLVKQIITEPVYHPTIKTINSWGKGILERRGEGDKFIKEFQTTFNSSFWELYLNKAFIDLGFNIDYSYESPDFHLIHSSGVHVNVEAVTSNNINNENEEYYSPNSLHEAAQIELDEFMDNSSIRLIGKIRDKKNLFIDNGKKKHPYSKLPHVMGNPFILAIAPFDNLLSSGQNNRAINRILYGIDTLPDGTVKRIPSIRTKAGNTIELGIFTNDSYKEISAIIFSTVGMFSKAIIEAKIPCKVRATKYRQFTIHEFKELSDMGIEKLGKNFKEFENQDIVLTFRYPSGNHIVGCDMYFVDSSRYKETHVDGLHIYYNPFASIPLERNIFSSDFLSYNNYDVHNNRMLADHNDGSLVSRNTYITF
ncbi:hypothetical protein M4F23_001026 [Salmonella enterica]|nr:hypothetical protein [Salmonella enterica]EJE2970401.1 hypothetical protein [Salmonella enterica]HAK7502905.1 hypothetical protein [Salmonella enterica]HCL5111389.1 hypothetical protein [Salmonella enterica]